MGWGRRSLGSTDEEGGSPLARASSAGGILAGLGAAVTVVAFHGLFAGSLVHVLQKNWVQSPAAIVITLAHVTIGSIGSVWLARIMPRVLNASVSGGWLSTMTVSFLGTVATSAWLGYTTFNMIPNVPWLTGVNFGYIGLFLTIPASIYFWQLGKFFSW